MHQKLFGHLTVTEGWDGKGLPPVGERVYTNTLNVKGNYEPAIIVAHVPQAKTLVAVYVLEDCEDWNWSSYGLDDGGQHCFLPSIEVDGRASA